MERGVITPSTEVLIDGERFTMKDGIPAERIRYLALYWDKVVLTDTNLMSTSLSDDAILLEDAGVLRKQKYRINPSVMQGNQSFPDMHLEALCKVTEELTLKNPGQWTLEQIGDQLILPPESTGELITADFKLHNCLPVPLPDYPIDKLIKFKYERKAELQAFRSCLDELYLEISKSQDIPRATIAQISRLKAAISDLDKVAKESWKQRFLVDRKVSIDLNLGSLKDGAITAGAIGASFNSPAIGLIAGAGATVLSSFKFELSSSLQPSSPVGKQLDLSYLSYVKKDKIVS
ncbi:DUF6236 family protein [Vibrio cyclitrophicus]|uniref:DUF6236 family protein n=1 Tax=Vibrio cyclitrophicus TaxID=47951 RepID=UPI000C85A767|nr:DUF6236 family protein [Vibrio cyclitrophicus]PMF43202.1 hypothetical protein BCV14_20135 [Vibrio cyclitrophicus]